jgi:hypothetical protein
VILRDEIKNMEPTEELLHLLVTNSCELCASDTEAIFSNKYGWMHITDDMGVTSLSACSLIPVLEHNDILNNK